tara:strand:- start:4201 stop:5058 length:858 start_codon:yes stop_codon:yes gene_type:complete
MLKFICLVSLIFLTTCNSPDKKSELKSLPTKEQAIQVYEEGLEALERGDYYFASKKFSEAEILLPQSDWAAKSALMVGYCLYSVNFYDEAILNLERFTKTYPASKNLDYVNYLIAISYYEQILDEEKDVKPVLKSKEKIELFLKKYPDTDYAIDLRYKLELVINQLAAKEISIARYYIKNEKWIAAINRLKVVVEDYDDTIFIEEALFRLVEIYYKIGLENEARAAAVLLGYNYNSSEWYKRSYAILNKDYSTQILKKKKEAKVWYEKDDLIKRKIRKIFRKNER